MTKPEQDQAKPKFYLDDLRIGQRFTTGSHVLDAAQIVAYAAQFDPQPFHLDDAAAAQTYFGRLSASGWHTACMAMRMSVDHWTEVGMQSLGSPGVDQLRWLKPVHPGDTLRLQTEWLDMRTSQTRPGLGLARIRWTVFNQHDVAVMQLEATQLMRRRPAE